MADRLSIGRTQVKWLCLGQGSLVPRFLLGNLLVKGQIKRWLDHLGVERLPPLLQRLELRLLIADF